MEAGYVSFLMTELANQYLSRSGEALSPPLQRRFPPRGGTALPALLEANRGGRALLGRAVDLSVPYLTCSKRARVALPAARIG